MQRRRIFLILFVVSGLFLALGARLVWMQTARSDHYRELAEELQRSTRFTSAPRGRILDGVGRVLAEDVPEHYVVFTLKDVVKTRWVARRTLRICERNSGRGDPFPYSEDQLVDVLEEIRSAVADQLGQDAPIAPRVWIDRLTDRQASAMEEALRRSSGPVRFPGLSVVRSDGEGSLHVDPALLFAGEAGIRRLGHRLRASGEQIDEPLYDFVAERYEEMGDPRRILQARLSRVEARLQTVEPDDRASLEHRAAQLRASLSDPAVIGQLRQQWFEREYELHPRVPFELACEVVRAPGRYPGLQVRERRRRVNLADDSLATLVGTVGKPTQETVARWIERGEPVVDSWYRAQGRLFGLRRSSTFLALRDGAHHSTDTVGRTGLERHFEEHLRGRPGARSYQFDVTGSPHGPALWEEPPLLGRSLTLTIDSALTREIADGLKEMQPVPYGASVLVADARTGEILAWVSHPGHDVSRRFASEAEYAAYQRERPGGAFLDRPRAAALPPGSIFKVVVALAALAEEVVTPEEEILCNGCYDPRNPNRLRCRNNALGAELDLVNALALSCNVYFYHVGGDRLGADAIAYWARQFGLWDSSSEWLPPLARCRPPTARSQPQMAAIGRGFTVTPMGMLQFALGLANRGRFIAPRLVREAPTVPPKVQPLDRSVWDQVIEGLEAAVDRGTARWSGVGLHPFDCAVKTGTAEKTYRDKLADGSWGPTEKKNVGWLLGFSPVEDPQVVFVVSIERTDEHGGDACGPIAARALKWLERQRGWSLRLSAEKSARASRTRGAQHGVGQ